MLTAPCIQSGCNIPGGRIGGMPVRITQAGG